MNLGFWAGVLVGGPFWISLWLLLSAIGSLIWHFWFKPRLERERRKYPVIFTGHFAGRP